MTSTKNTKQVVECKIVSESGRTALGARVRLHYYVDDHGTAGVCRSMAIILGVGTAMKATDYDGIGRAIAAELRTDAIVIIIDSFPLVPIKLFSRPFANAVNGLVAELQRESFSNRDSIRGKFLLAGIRLCPFGTRLHDSTDGSPSGLAFPQLRIVVGGHSASGSAAFYAVIKKYFGFPVAGFIGLDPYMINSGANISIPAMNWGFSNTTCAVNVKKAALAAYDQTKVGFRVLYRLQNDIQKNNKPFAHCDFSDAGCFSCPLRCGSECINDLHHDVGVSVRLFLQAITADPKDFSRHHFETNDYRLDQRDFTLVLDDVSGAQHARMSL